ncbi:hypothetical protein [Raineya orbicola]|jgi:hypothetical protein|uniref:Uncharacterized protein n=1 Tax=Raineya orbicola TaxID=2016530 RepID=A0A2N3IF37_9BACT|nr:hypothetical protein [Raineya orbicola]PKQ68917.1 hypothetical protein Rain11_1572 [Raineya orbicola]
MKKVIFITLLLVWLPFLLLTDIFPFLRFGMFAEPVHSVRQEFFEIYTLENGKLRKFNTYLWGIDEGVFHYLVRKYYYQNRMNEFWEKICLTHRKLYPDNLPQTWQLYQITLLNGTKEKKRIATYAECKP